MIDAMEDIIRDDGETFEGVAEAAAVAGVDYCVMERAVEDGFLLCGHYYEPLALYAATPPQGLPDAVKARAVRAWRAGVPLRDISARVGRGVSCAQLRRWAANLERDGKL